MKHVNLKLVESWHRRRPNKIQLNFKVTIIYNCFFKSNWAARR